MTCANFIWSTTLAATILISLAATAANVARAVRSYRGGGTLWRVAIIQALVCFYVATLYCMLACGSIIALDDSARMMFRAGVLMLTVSVLIEALVDL